MVERTSKTRFNHHYHRAIHMRTESSESIALRNLESAETLLPEPCGKPGGKQRVPVKDLYLLSVEVLCLVAGLLVVFYSHFAIFLGQINQLIAVGFLLSVMAICLEGGVLRTALIHIATRNGSLIQDLDALMRKDPFASKIHLAYRMLLLFLLGLPLLLSIAYKRFVGGETTIIVDGGDGFFGFSSTPGKQRIGDGLSLLSDVYVPFWIKPDLNQTYGFNMYIASNNKTAVIVDSPFPSYLTSLQSALLEGQSLSLSATVNATVSEMVNPTDEERNSDDFWLDVQKQFGHPATQNGGDVRGANNALWAGMSGNFLTNFSVMYFSAWNTTRNETFFSEAIRTEQTRREAKATWRILSSNITLINAELVANSTLADQSLLQSNAIGLQEMFSTFLGEYDWHNRVGAFDFPYPDLSGGQLRSFQSANTIPALAAAMAWARITSLDTKDRPAGIQNSELRALTGYTKKAGEIFTIKSVPTLRRQPLLLMVLLVNPSLALGCILMKALCLYESPIGDDFNTIALIAAAEESDLSVLEGASLTGELTKTVRVVFNVERGRLTAKPNDAAVDHIVMALNQVAPRRGRIHTGVMYS